MGFDRNPHLASREASRKAPAAVLSVYLARGESAWGVLREPRFIDAWATLAASCPWGTAFQASAFVVAWYEVHEPIWEPVVVVGRTGDGEVSALLTLAVDRDGRLAAAGDFHAEYQTIIATPTVAEQFAQVAMRRLRRAYPGATLRLAYVPPGAPLRWTRSGPSARLTEVRGASRGLMDLGAVDRIEAAIRKSHRRSRLNRLRRLGEVRFEVMTDPATVIAQLDRVAIMVDLRQGAVHGSRPFGDNPYKRPLHEALIRNGVLLASFLHVGDKIASVHLDVVNGDSVLLYLIAHDPRLAGHSPGDLHIYLLARELARLGYATYDLSPGAGYKERYADLFDPVAVVTVRFSLRGRAVALVSRVVRGVARLAVTRVGREPRDVAVVLRRWQTSLGPIGWRMPLRVVRRSSVPRGSVVLSFDRSSIREQPSDRPLEAERLDDLLAMRLPGEPAAEQAFLQVSLERLEGGSIPWTRCEAGRLVECWWISPGEARIELGHLDRVARRPERLSKSIDQILAAAARMANGSSIAVELRPNESELRQLFVRAGGRAVIAEDVARRSPSDPADQRGA